jgi:hypothetical protein
MKNYKFYFSILAMTLFVLIVACSEEQENANLGAVSLTFKKLTPDLDRQNDSIFIVDVIIESISPLQVISDEVTVMTAIDENGNQLEGLALIADAEGREVVRPGYFFNSGTQCWVWGRWITDTTTGQVDFQFGSASEQAYHNVCAPSGSYYAKIAT